MEAASIGQVHRAVTHDGADVAQGAVPGVDAAIESDPDAAEVMYAMFALMLKGLDAKSLVDELRQRMREELDYELEAENVREFGRIFAGHPWVRVPRLVPEFSTRRVLTTEWVDGMSFEEFRRTASPATKQRAGEVIWRFAQHAVLRHGGFNGDPHPGNYKFHHDGSVTFLDFGLVKRWSPGEWEILAPTLDAIVVKRDPQLLVAAMEASGFLKREHGLDANLVYQYVSSPYEPYLSDEFAFSRKWMSDTIGKMFDVQGPHQPVISAQPAGDVRDPRPRRGASTPFWQARRRGPFRAMLLEYIADGEPATDPAPPRQPGGRPRFVNDHLGIVNWVTCARRCGHAARSLRPTRGRGVTTPGRAAAPVRRGLSPSRLARRPVGGARTDDPGDTCNVAPTQSDARRAGRRGRRRHARAIAIAELSSPRTISGRCTRIDPALDPNTARTIDLVGRCGRDAERPTRYELGEAESVRPRRRASGERLHRRLLPPQAVDDAARRPVVVAAVCPPLNGLR